MVRHFVNIQKPDPKIVQKMTIQKPDRLVFGCWLYWTYLLFGSSLYYHLKIRLFVQFLKCDDQLKSRQVFKWLSVLKIQLSWTILGIKGHRGTIREPDRSYKMCLVFEWSCFWIVSSKKVWYSNGHQFLFCSLKNLRCVLFWWEEYYPFALRGHTFFSQWKL
jgi:hypothetical protein